MTYFVTELSVATEIEDEPIKWIFSSIMALIKSLIFLKTHSHAKMAPDTAVREGFFRKDEFRYDAERDAYICPAGQVLATRYESKLRDLKKFDYSNRAACLVCAIRSRCTKDYRQGCSTLFLGSAGQRERGVLGDG